jgi:hypothetical protein
VSCLKSGSHDYFFLGALAAAILGLDAGFFFAVDSPSMSAYVALMHVVDTGRSNIALD